MHQIAVILINYNTSAYTIECVESIYNKTSKDINFQVVIVDNCSQFDDFIILENYVNAKKFIHLKLVRNTINSGFGSGNMLGFLHTNASYIAFVNNDVVFLNDCLQILLNAIQNNPLIGVCGPINFTKKGKFLSTLDHFASLKKEILGRKFLEFWNPKEFPNRKKPYDMPQKGQLISGSFMFMAAKDFKEIGGFDTNIFLYHEETDLCLRLRTINKFAFLIPDAQIIHHHGASSKKSILLKTEIKLSLLYVIKKHYGYLHFKLLLTYLQIRYGLVSLFKPKYRHLSKVLFRGAKLSDSLKYKQISSK